MADIATQRTNVNGVPLTFSPADPAGDTIEGTAKLLVVVKNTGLTDAVLTVVVPGSTTYGETLPPKDYTVSASGTLGFSTVADFVDKATKKITLMPDAGSTLELAVLAAG